MTIIWKYNNVDLSTFGVITTFDDFLDLPEARGRNMMIPFQHGTRFTQKFYDERSLQMGITITAATADALETALGSLRALLAPRVEQTLSMTLADTTVRTVPASVNKSMQINRPVPWVAKLVIEFELSQPFFRLSTLIADNTVVVNSSPKAWVVTNPGTAIEYRPTITIDGPFTSITILNSINGVSLTYIGTIGAAETVIISADANGNASAILSTGSANVISGVSHSGASALMIFNPGANTMSITSAGGNNTGTVKASFYPPYV
jgi:phage-related protein